MHKNQMIEELYDVLEFFLGSIPRREN